MTWNRTHVKLQAQLRKSQFCLVPQKLHPLFFRLASYKRLTKHPPVGSLVTLQGRAILLLVQLFLCQILKWDFLKITYSWTFPVWIGFTVVAFYLNHFTLLFRVWRYVAFIPISLLMYFSVKHHKEKCFYYVIDVVIDVIIYLYDFLMHNNYSFTCLWYVSCTLWCAFLLILLLYI